MSEALSGTTLIGQQHHSGRIEKQSFQATPE
jgi:hypothetical protein